MSLVFRDTILTNKGFEVSNKAALGKTQFSIVKAVSTDVDLTNYKIEDLKNLTSLPNEIESGSILDYDSPQNSISVIKINFDNSKFRDGYTVRAVGLYGKDSDGNEFLHSLSVSENPIVIPQVTNNIFDGLSHSIAIFSGDNKNMTVNLVQSGYATIHYVDDSISKLSDDIQNIIKPSLDQKADKIEVAEGMDNLSNQSKQGFDNLGGMLQPLLDVDEIKRDVSNRFVDYKNGLNGKQDNVGITESNNHLYYNGIPILTATAPNQPKIKVETDHTSSDFIYTITPPALDGGASVTSYDIFYKKTVDDNWHTKNIDNSNLIGHMNIQSERGSQYIFKVSANNYAGKSTESDIINVLAANKPQITGLKIETELDNDMGTNVKFSIETNDNGSKITGYKLMFNTDLDKEWKSVPFNNSYGVMNIPNQLNEALFFTNKVYVKASATNILGESELSNVQSSLLAFSLKGSIAPENTVYIGNTSTRDITTTGIIYNHNKPMFTFPYDISNKDIHIEIRNDIFIHDDGTSIHADSIGPGYGSIKNTNLYIQHNALDNSNLVNIEPQLNINRSSYTYGLYIQRIDNNTIKLFDSIKSDEKATFAAVDKGAFPVIKSIAAW